MKSTQSYSALLSQLKRYLQGQQSDNRSTSKDTITLQEIELGLPAMDRDDEITKYILALLGESESQGVEDWIENSPLKFLSGLSSFISALAHLDRGNMHTKTLMLPLYRRIMKDFGTRVESGALNSEQIQIIRDAEKRFNQGDKSDLGFSTRLVGAEVKKHSQEIANRLYAEVNKSPQSKEDRLRFLMAIDGLISYSKCLDTFKAIDIEGLIGLLADLKDLASLENAGEVDTRFESRAKIQAQIEDATIQKLKATQPKNLSKRAQDLLLEIGLSTGAKPESIGRAILDFFFPEQPSLASNPKWWRYLPLDDLVDTCKLSPLLRDSILDSAAEGTWLEESVSRFLANAGSAKDLSLGFESNALFGIPDAQGLTRIWKFLAPKSELLRNIESQLVEEPLAESESNHKATLQKNQREFEVEVAKLRSEIEKLKADLKNTESAVVRSQEAIGGSKAGLEIGVAKKYSEALGRFIRRIERESSKRSLPDILAKESASFSRLGIELLLSGSEVPYDSLTHDAVGYSPKIGERVTIVESGMLLTIGDIRLTVLKALVRPTS